MKKITYTIAVAFLLGSCNNAEKKQEQQAEEQSAISAAIDSVNQVNARNRMIDSLNRTPETNNDIAIGESTVSAPTHTTHHAGHTHTAGTHGTASTPSTTPGTSGTNTVAGSSSGATTTPGATSSTVAPASTGNGTVASTPEEKKKKGLNNAAKGAIIGAGAGAIGGAVINKENRGKGAIIGGAVGAGAGALGGVILDKRKKKREAEDTASTKGK